jgi:hypothetical protein
MTKWNARVWFAALLACGCASSDDVGSSEMPQITFDAGAGVRVDAASAEAGPMCTEGAQLKCACSSGMEGTSTCTAGSFSPCLGCETTKAKCLAGVYRFRGKGTYASTAAGLCGIIGVDAGDPQDSDGTFTLQENGDLEFAVINGGCLRPPAGSAGESIKWRGKFSGRVDCASGELVGELKSIYNVVSFCTFGLFPDDYFAKGPFRGKFDAETQTFVGDYELHEPKVLFGNQPGGKGTFQATYDPTLEDSSLGQDCLDGVAFKDELFEGADAGP